MFQYLPPLLPEVMGKMLEYLLAVPTCSLVSLAQGLPEQLPEEGDRGQGAGPQVTFPVRGS